MSKIALTADRVFDGEAMRKDVAVVIEGVLIVDVVARSGLGSSVPLRDLGQGVLAPGFIDLQVNGGGGVLLNETPTVEAVRAIAAAHRRFGTTGLLPTVITDSQTTMWAAADAVSEAIRDAAPGVLGIHIEGPFIDPKRKGAHDPRFIRTPTEKDMTWLEGLQCGRVLITLAPNCVAANMISRLAQSGITVSLGHSDATSQEALAAIAAGASGFTHLFNAMSQLTGRAPGMVGAALASECWCGIIADGHHVDPVALKAAIAAKPDGGVFFVSDAMPSAAGGPDAFTLQGRPVRVVDRRLQLADGTLAGATITMLDTLTYGNQSLGLSVTETLRMASLYPAEAIDLDDSYGRIAPGFRANLVHLSSEPVVLETWIDGKSSR